MESFMAKFMRFAILLAGLFSAGNAFAAGGACPAGVPVTGNNCHFVAATGSDSNNGTSETTPWLHSPGMANCSGNCAALQAGNAGIGIIFRGGDTWHFGNPNAAPYTGGALDLYNWFSNSYGGSISNCVYEGNQSGCLYVGVDTTWYNTSTCGGSWCRPVLTGDNPTLPGAGSFVSSCAYQVSGNNFGPNNLVVMPPYTILDNFELTGMCSSASSTSQGDTYLAGWASSGTYTSESFLENSYLHGWTATQSAGTGSASHPIALISGGGGVFQVLDHDVIDGSDSNPEIAAWAPGTWFYHIRDNMIRYVGQGYGAQCHDIHDNIFEHFYTTELDGHYNVLECNHDAGPNQSPATNTPNVVYNNVMRHFDPSFAGGEDFWFCPNSSSEYWFNNLQYDISGQPWAMAGTTQYPDCTNTGGQFLFNNTFVDTGAITCHGSGSNVSGGRYFTAYNNHLIGTTFDSAGCTGYSDASNVIMSDSKATSQGYTTGTAGTTAKNTCANDATTPCVPTAGSNTTVGIGRNLMNNASLTTAVGTSWCATLATYSSTDPSVGVDAATACKYGTTDGCAYNQVNHSMVCPSAAWLAVIRPSSNAWNSGAYQFSGPTPPTNVKGSASPN
jgi:hypothetical protein